MKRYILVLFTERFSNGLDVKYVTGTINRRSSQERSRIKV